METQETCLDLTALAGDGGADPRSRVSEMACGLVGSEILRTLTDHGFRDALEANPQVVLGRPMSASNQHEIRLVLAAVKGMEAQIKALGNELHCLSDTPPGWDSPG